MYSDNFENLTTEQKILKAAQKEFSQKGFAGAKTTAIAKAAYAPLLFPHKEMSL